MWCTLYFMLTKPVLFAHRNPPNSASSEEGGWGKHFGHQAVDEYCHYRVSELQRSAARGLKFFKTKITL